MIRRLTCTECPQGCILLVDTEDSKVKSVQGGKCPKGTAYAVMEAECPSRVLTATVRAYGLSLKFVPVRTDKAIPKKDLARAVEAIRKMKVAAPLKPGDVIDKDFLGLKVRLVATREATVKT